MNRPSAEAIYAHAHDSMHTMRTGHDVVAGACTPNAGALNHARRPNSSTILQLRAGSDHLSGSCAVASQRTRMQESYEFLPILAPILPRAGCT
eukprot:CAMPEP_0170182076 /NCGR_PEP_ID=MMETSP0040_2-20121228/26852_1 /TAXON_ID=641309 /ORGANISM="Lotharella oceanica, Strain CCMP622" /LENGTH=92 /DNA_ID=CAMNT_0010427361 /DNA_START=169 /DNA_END=447 /DNA_ORIENTATION=-